MVKLIQKQVIADQGSHPSFKDVKAWYDSKLHPDVINENDESVYDCYGEGKFAGLFQFTAAGAQKFIQRIKPKNIIDIATATSIYRPGPLAAKVDDIYQQAKEAPHKIEYEHPLTKQVLEQTFNCVSGDTLISLENEKISIKDVVSKYEFGGCNVYSYNEKENKIELDELVVACDMGVKETITIETSTGLLTLTSDHKVYTKRGWIEAGQLTVDDEILINENEK